MTKAPGGKASVVLPSVAVIITYSDSIQDRRTVPGATRETYDVYLFLRAAITNDHNLGDLKQQKIVISQFWKPEV